MHALIIEDDMNIARLIADALSDLGFSSFDFAHTADLAIMLAGAKTPDLITVDALLKIGSGLDAVQVIRASTAIPVVFLTAAPAGIEKIFADPVVLAKPFTIKSLYFAADRAMGRKVGPI